MDFTLPSIATYLGSWFALIGGIWTLFDRAETVASEEAKSKVAAWLNSDVTPSSSKWSSFVLQGFNNIFGAKQLSLHCFLYSSLASVIFVISFLLLFLAIRPEQGQELFESGPIVLFWLLLISAAFNLIPDQNLSGHP